jgi:hypothetical protein
VISGTHHQAGAVTPRIDQAVTCRPRYQDCGPASDIHAAVDADNLAGDVGSAF